MSMCGRYKADFLHRISMQKIRRIIVATKNLHRIHLEIIFVVQILNPHDVNLCCIHDCNMEVKICNAVQFCCENAADFKYIDFFFFIDILHTNLHGLVRAS